MSMLMRATIRGDIVGNAYANVFAFLCADSGGEGAASMAAKLAAALNDSVGFLGLYAGAQTPLCKYHSIVTRRDDGPGPAFILFQPELAFGEGQTPEATPDIEAPNVAVGIKWMTTPIKRSGRTFYPGVSEACFTSGVLDDTYATTLIQPFCDYYIASHTVGTFSFQGVIRNRVGVVGGYSVIEQIDFARSPYQQGRRRYPIGG